MHRRHGLVIMDAAVVTGGGRSGEIPGVDGERTDGEAVFRRPALGRGGDIFDAALQRRELIKQPVKIAGGAVNLNRSLHHEVFDVRLQLQPHQ